jgi:hypothetical protein
MTENLEWDWPPTKRYRKTASATGRNLAAKTGRAGTKTLRVEIILRSQQRSTTNWPILIVAVVTVIFLWRYSLALLLLGVVAWKLVAAMLMMAAVVAVAAWRERRYGRPF